MASREEWLMVVSCPACGSNGIAYQKMLSGTQYTFGNESISYPDQGIPISECADCGLIYKGLVPHPNFLTTVFERNTGAVWTENYDYTSEKTLIKDHIYGNHMSLLDVGPSNGNLIQACNDIVTRCSGLDIVRHPGASEAITGEFIDGLLDDEALKWSNDPYDIITVFDVFEHFYQPNVAFNNINQLLKPDGCVILETGNAICPWALRHGVDEWWYTRLFEHHIFWTPKSFIYLAAQHGFKVIHCVNKKHKQANTHTLKTKIRSALDTIKYVLNKNNHDQPWSPHFEDHFQVVMIKG